MGTNYYWNPELVQQAFGIENIEQDDPKVHIGKQSAMRGYCKACGITRSGHTMYVHSVIDDSITHPNPDAVRAYIEQDTCPNCNAPWENNLCSFTFTMMGHLVTISNLYNIEMMSRQKDPLYTPLNIVIDDYGVLYTATVFLDDILRHCPVQFQDYGRWS